MREMKKAKSSKGGIRTLKLSSSAFDVEVTLLQSCNNWKMLIQMCFFN